MVKFFLNVAQIVLISPYIWRYSDIQKVECPKPISSGYTQIPPTHVANNMDGVCNLRYNRHINAAKESNNQAITDALGPSVCIQRASTTKPISAGVVAKE